MDSAQFSWGSSPLPGASWYTWPLSKAEKIQRCFELFGRELSELEDQVATNGNEILEVSDPDSFIRNNVAVEPMKEAVAAHLGVDPVDICLIRAICNYFTGATGLCLAEVDGVDYRKSFSNWCKGEMKSVESRRIFHCYAIPSSYWSHEASVQLLDEELNKLQGRLRMIYGDDPASGCTCVNCCWMGTTCPH